MNKFSDDHREYCDHPFLESEASHCPFAQFTLWFDEAKRHSNAANAMTLCTVEADHRPSARIVLMKDFSKEQGVVFYTHYNSPKGLAIKENPHVAVVFWWEAIEQQVRIEGQAEKIAKEESVRYFQSRPRESQIASIISKQSQEVADRQALEHHFKEASAQFTQPTLECPEHWGGYRIVPERFEFWQGRPARLSDRLAYQRQSDGSWQRTRLSP